LEYRKVFTQHSIGGVELSNFDSLDDPVVAQPLKPGIKERIAAVCVREFPFAVVLVVFAIGNLVLPSVFFNFASSDGWMILACFFNGVLASEVAILASICVLRTADWQVRLIAGVLGLAGLATTLVLGLSTADSQLPNQIAIFIYCIAVAIYIAVAIGSYFVKKRTGLIVEHGFGTQTISQRKQYSVGFLLGVMAVVAVLISVVRASLPANNASGGPSIAELILRSGLFMTYSIMLFVPSIAIGIAKRRTIRWIGVLFTMVIGFVVMQNLAQLNGSPLPKGFYVYFYAYSLGVVTSVVAVFGWLRWHGYRMSRTG
jgi:hypothetical protein